MVTAPQKIIFLSVAIFALLVFSATTALAGQVPDTGQTTCYDSNPETNGGDAGSPGDGTDTEDFIAARGDGAGRCAATRKSKRTA